MGRPRAARVTTTDSTATARYPIILPLRSRPGSGTASGSRSLAGARAGRSIRYFRRLVRTLAGGRLRPATKERELGFDAHPSRPLGVEL